MLPNIDASHIATSFLCPHRTWVVLCKLLNLSVPQFLIHKKGGGINSGTYFPGLLEY